MIKRNLPLMITIGVFVLGYIYCLTQFPGFASTRVICNILTDNAFLGIIAVGMTFVILSGGIDLSVGSVIAFTGVFLAKVIGDFGLSPLLAFPLVLVMGCAFGAFMGLLIDALKIPAFIITQAGYALAGVGVELDAIASVVIGGTLLSGGVGTVLGTLFGVAIQGLIQTYINFDGTLSSWWTKIAIGILLFIFIALQRGLTVLWENRQSSPVTRVNIAQR
ncbi:hypothetical protein AB2F46_23185 [Escherichia coli]|nr:hypothetical protein [Escherichia coli]